MSYQCPKCNSNDLRVQCTVVVRLLGNGTIQCNEPLSEFQWDEDSEVLCNACEFWGHAWRFDTEHNK